MVLPTELLVCRSVLMFTLVLSVAVHGFTKTLPLNFFSLNDTVYHFQIQFKV